MFKDEIFSIRTDGENVFWDRGREEEYKAKRIYLTTQIQVCSFPGYKEYARMTSLNQQFGMVLKKILKEKY